MSRPLDWIVGTFKGTAGLETGGRKTAVGGTNKVPWEPQSSVIWSPPSSPKTPSPPTSTPLPSPPPTSQVTTNTTNHHYHTPYSVIGSRFHIQNLLCQIMSNCKSRFDTNEMVDIVQHNRFSLNESTNMDMKSAT